MASSDYYFFTDTNLLVVQTAGAYGPIAKTVSTDPDEYRVTSLHTATANPTAYAACDAILCVQRIPSTSLVNIILKPLVQPALNFAPVKYIIYKGILTDSLINGTEIAAAATNDLTKSIWKSQMKKNASALTIATPPANALGLGLILASSPDLADTEPIDNLFYRASEVFQLPVVNGGWSIGQFDKAKFGIEVLMEGLAFHHPLSLARKLEHKISVPALASNATEATKFDHWHDKEQILGYIDPCSFYGSFFLAGIQAKTSGSTAFASKAGNALYQDALFAFANKNRAYLDIRNEHNFSLNYFKNYGNFIKLGGGAPVDYYASKWPILTLTAPDFATNTATARNAFSIQLPVGDNPQPLIYVSQGYRDINATGGEFPAELSNAERFYDTFEAPVGGYTATKSTSALNSLAFAVPNITGHAATTPVSCYIRLKYFKQQQGATSLSTVIKSENYLDNLIYPIDLRVLFGGPANIKSSLYDEEIYVNARNVPGLRFDIVGKLGIARDAANTSFFVIPTVVRANEGQVSSLITLCGETSENSETFANLIASKYPLTRVRKSDLILSATALAPIAEFVSDADISALSKFDAPDFSKFLIFVVANSTYDAWKSRVSATGGDLDNRFRVYLGVKNLQTQTDTAGIPYLSFELALRGFARDATGNNYEVRETGTDSADSAANITVYSSAPAPVTCRITSGADGMSTACVPVGGIIQLKAAPSSGSGTYQWSTTSAKITLNNTAAQTVTILAKNQISSSRGAEKVQLVFTPTGGTPLPPITRDITVIKVEYKESPHQSYGYDDMDKVVGVNHHVSVRRVGFTKVLVTVSGGGTAADLEFVSDDATIAVAEAPDVTEGDEFDLKIGGKDQIKAQTSIRAICKGGPICATIEVNVYQEVVVCITVAKLWDGTNPATTLSYRNRDMAAVAARINSTYRSIVARIEFIDVTPTNVNGLAYDLDGSGTLTYGGDSTPEIQFIRNALQFNLVPDEHTSVAEAIVVKDFTYIFYLGRNATSGDTTLTLKGGKGVDFSNIKHGVSYTIGQGASPEQVTFGSHVFVDLDGDGFNESAEYTLSPSGTQIAHNHSTSEGIIRLVAGIRIFPIVALEQATEEGTDWILAHEIGHLPKFGFHDLDAPTNLMHNNAGFTDHKLRFKEQLRHNAPTNSPTENQWEKVTRD